MKILYIKQIYCVLGVILTWMLFISPLPAQAEEFRSPLKSNGETVQGDWQRTDGNYMIRVEPISQDNPLTVQYYNPAPVHVAQSHTFLENGVQGIFVKLEDNKYQGSTYTLYYDNKQDALVGYYFHGQLQKRFKVIFLRRNP